MHMPFCMYTYFLFDYLHTSVSLYTYMHVSVGAAGGQKGAPDLLELELRQL